MKNLKDLRRLGKLQKAITKFMNTDMCPECQERLIEIKRRVLME